MKHKNWLKTTIASVLLMVTMSVPVIASPIANIDKQINVEEEVNSIYTQKLIEAGLIDESTKLDSIAQVASFTDDIEKTYNEVNAYIDVDGNLENAYDVIYRSVATGKTGTLSNTDVMGFVITVNYNYFYPSQNGYQDPYYQHGSMKVKASSNYSVESIDNFKCLYLSRGIQTDSEGYWTGDFIEAESLINANHLSAGETWTMSGSNIGRPYIAKNSSTVPNGTAFSGIAYAFTYNGEEYKDSKVLFYDDSSYFLEFDWGVWEFFAS